MPDNFSAADVQAIQVMERGGPPPATPPAGEQPSNVGAPAPQVQTPTAPTVQATPPAQGGSQPGGTPPETPSEGQEEFDYMNLEDLGFQDMSELQQRLERAQQLEQELEQLQEYKNGPKFASDRQKYLYDFANRFEGMELPAAQQLLNVVSLDLKSLPDQQARFEAFRLDPINKGLSQDDLMALFTDEERLKFGNSQDPADPQTPAQKAREKQATALAKEQLSKMQSEWNATRTAAKTPEELVQEKQAYQEEVFERLSKFGGIQVNLSAQGDNGENAESAMQFALNDENQIQEIVEAVADPLGWWDNMLYDTGVLTEGQQGFDAVKFAQLVTVITHREQLLNNAYQQGREDYKASLLKNARNVSVPGNGLGTPPVPPGTMTEKQEANKEAMKVAGII
jgi:hypothetical protein